MPVQLDTDLDTKLPFLSVAKVLRHEKTQWVARATA